MPASPKTSRLGRAAVANRHKLRTSAQHLPRHSQRRQEAAHRQLCAGLSRFRVGKRPDGMTVQEQECETCSVRGQLGKEAC